MFRDEFRYMVARGLNKLRGNLTQKQETIFVYLLKKRKIVGAPWL